MRRIVTILILAGLSVTGFVGASPASAQVTPTVDITSATLIARGAALEVTYTVTCEAGLQGFVSASITQRVGPRIAQGSGGTSFTCTGSPQTVTVLATAFGGGGAPFRQGTAVTSTVLELCGELGCRFSYFNEVIAISRR